MKAALHHSWKKPTVTTTWLIVLIATNCMMCTGCAAQDSQPTQPSLQPDTTAHVAAPAVDSPEVDVPTQDGPPAPPAKPKAEIEQLAQMRSAATAQERSQLMTPRLEGWIKERQLLYSGDDPAPNVALDDTQFQALTSQEKLAYQLFYPEDFAQSGLGHRAFSGNVLAISRKLPALADGLAPSERQMQAVRKDSNAIKKIILNSLETNRAASVELLYDIVALKLIKAIPLLIQIYQGQALKDDLLLTTLVALMEHSNFWPWIYSPEFKAMLVDPNETIPLTPPNIDKIITMAQKLASR